MGQLGVSGLAELRKVLRAFYRFRREPTPENNRKLVELRFLGAHQCPSCDEELDLNRLRRADRDGRIQEWLICPSCGDRFDLTDVPVQ